jgi:hypothetical protein
MSLTAFMKGQQSFFTGLIATFAAAVMLQLLGMLWEYAWILMVVAGFLGGFLIKRAGQAFLAGLLGVLLAWLVYFIAFSFLGPIWNFANLLAGLFGLTGMGLVVIVLALVLVGGLIGGLGALNGHFVSSLLFKSEAKEK